MSAALDVCRPITIQRGVHGRSPIFLVPGAGASVTSFLSLVAGLKKDIPIHGFEPRGLDCSYLPHRTVPAIAASCLEFVREIQPVGPYRLAGHSFGGWVVLDIALQMQQLGERVEPLLLIDSEPPAIAQYAPRPQIGRVDALLKLMELMVQSTHTTVSVNRIELEQLDEEAQLRRVLGEMQRIGAIAKHATLAAVRNLISVFEANLNTHYVPGSRFEGAALLVLAVGTLRDSDQTASRRQACRLGWEKRVATVEIAESLGAHMTVLQPPYVDQIAIRMSQLWKR